MNISPNVEIEGPAVESCRTAGASPEARRVPWWKRNVDRVIAQELSTITRYCDQLVQLMKRAEDPGTLMELADCPRKSQAADLECLPASTDAALRTAVLLNGTLNHHLDIQGLLQEVKPRLSRGSRILAVVYNPYMSWLFRLANALGLRKGEVPSTFITHTDLSNLARLAGYQIVRIRPAVYCPFRLLGIGWLLNTLLPSIPIVRHLGLVAVAVLRPVIPEGEDRPSLSIVIPARNERGNIEDALRRMPDLGTETEIVFVEGHSSDGTWEEIERVVAAYSGGRFKLQAHRQTGKGKSDAVRLGFSKATGEVLTILDADLTMPPELLGRFFDAYCEGQADFVNGTRLVYPMEGEAMRFLNRLGNVFFAKALSSVLDSRLGDSLCGTKLLSRQDYGRMTAWRSDFGDFDPFGDFELLFPAAVLGLGIVDIPIRYRARTYGSTNISRFRHGFMLLKMTLTGLFRIKMGKG